MERTNELIKAATYGFPAVEKKIELSLTKEDAMTLKMWVELGVFDEIRNDDEIDNLEWVHKWIHIVEKLNNLFKEMPDDYA